MDADTLVATLQAAVPDAQVELAPSIDLQTTIYVARDSVPALARTLRDDPAFGFSVLVELTAVDFGPREPRYELIYLFVSIANRLRLRMKVRLAADDPHVASVTALWPAANWLEREVWDMFGIAFDGLPDPRRLLMPEDWQGYPLRKDYPVQIRMTPTSSQDLQVTEEEFRSNLMKDRLVRGR